MATARNAALVAGTVAVAGVTYFLKSNSEDVMADFRDAIFLGKLQREIKALAHAPWTYVSVFDATAAKYPNEVAAIYLDESGVTTSYTWKEIDLLSNQVANWALGQDLHVGDRVALVMDNRPEFVIIWLGLAKIGVQTALINTNLVGNPLKHCLTVVTPKLFILGREHVHKCVDLRKEMGGAVWYASSAFKTVVTGHSDATHQPLPEGFEDIDHLILTRNHSRPVTPATPSTTPLVFIYTSGTTGLPKAAPVVSLRYAMASFAFAQGFKMQQKDRIYCTLPLYHSAGGMLGVGMSWASGATLVIRRKFSAKNFWRDCVLNECTAIQYIGELCRYLTLHPESQYDTQHKIRIAIGNGLRPDVWSKFQERFRVPAIGEFYGATEGNCALLNLRNKFGSIGNLPAVVSKLGLAPFYLFKFDVESETVVRDANGRCIRCEPGEVGEMLGKIDVGKNPLSRFDGYSNKEATEKKILRDVESEGDQWFRTGDLLYCDAVGNYYFVDRIGDTFRWKGENVSTNEVAEVIAGVKGVKEANVYGVTIPEHDGRACMAALVVDDTFELTSLYQHVKQNLPSYARPIFVRLTEAMDLTGTFKHQKVEFRNQGFDPSKTKDPIYFVDHTSSSYRRVDADMYKRMTTDKAVLAKL